jgi:hypothetical protein
MPVVCIETQRARIRIARRIVSLQSTLYVFFGSRTVDGAEMIEKMTLAIGQTALLEKSRAPARARSVVIQAHYTVEMSALLASSFVGRVAAFKATKVQVRIS